MIGKAKSISHAGAAIDYALNKDQAYELTKEGVIGDSGQEIASEFRMFQDLNGNCKNNSLSVVLSPAVKDGQELSKEQLTSITKDYLKEMRLEGHQYVAYVHQDKAHKHIHLFVNRVSEQGKAYNDSYIGKASQRAADSVAKDHGLTRAKEVQQQKELGLKQTKQQLKEIHLKVMGTKPKSFESYSKLMEGKGVKIAPSINKQGAMQGFRVGLNKDTMLKASQVWKGMTLSSIQPLFALAKTITRDLGNDLIR